MNTDRLNRQRDQNGRASDSELDSLEDMLRSEGAATGPHHQKSQSVFLGGRVASSRVHVKYMYSC